MRAPRESMAETAASLAIGLVSALIRQLQTMAAADATARKFLQLVKNVAYTLQGAQERGAFRSSPGSILQNLKILHSALQRLEKWINDYNHAGRTKGRLARMRDYFYAGKNLEELNNLCKEIDDAIKCLDLSLNLEICAGVKDLVEQQSGVAREVFDMIQKHSGSADDRELAEAIAKKTDIAIDDVKQELKSSIEQLRIVDDNVKKILAMVEGLYFLQVKSANVAPGISESEDVAQSLELAPFSVAEWVDERHGTPHASQSPLLMNLST